MPEDFALYDKGIKYLHISTGGTHVVRDGPVFLDRILVNTPASGSITVYNNNAASGEEIAVITTGAFIVLPFRYGFILDIGLTIDLSTAMDITVIYQ
jgi:hypothetical protein